MSPFLHEGALNMLIKLHIECPIKAKNNTEDTSVNDGFISAVAVYVSSAHANRTPRTEKFTYVKITIHSDYCSYELPII